LTKTIAKKVKRDKDQKKKQRAKEEEGKVNCFFFFGGFPAAFFDKGFFLFF